MRLYHSIGYKTTRLLRAFIFFFVFFGHFFYCLIGKFTHIHWKSSFLGVLRAGSKLVIPMMLVCMLIGTTMAISIHYFLTKYNLQNQAMYLVQNMIIRDLVPIIIGFVLCVHCSFNLIDEYHPSLNRSPDQVMLETIIPLVVGVGFTALILYTYLAIAFLTSIFFAFYFLLQISTDEYLLRLSEFMNPYDFGYSILKTVFYASIASFTAGYYYYDVANRILPTRRAVSRIITRGLLWLVIGSVLMKLYLN